MTRVGYDTRSVHGPFYRLVSGTQNATTIVKQVLSGELWGEPPVFGLDPAAQAHRGRLPPSDRGFEFWSFQAPDNWNGPQVFWRKLGEFLVPADNLDVVKLSIAFVKIAQSLHEYAP
ncbi:hypothetical protein [Conexibacter sp. DBS9H8]|uniref:hypothetical protein n=1 Tax=Conexibacter sp. DBS9H8 TaxID=2937801 RepID=UPI00200C4E46|nr:hypothetical protein [Conexibacter sp. DBS9H8]